jgi:hypothetical protein
MGAQRLAGLVSPVLLDPEDAVGEPHIVNGTVG